MLPPLGRIPGLLQLVEEGNYFVLHAPRQSGKTTAIQALVDILNEKGDMCALYFSVESVQAFADPAIGMPRIVRRILSDLARHPLFSGLAKELLAAPTLPEFRDLLIDMAQTCPKPLALFFDEVDALSDGTLITFLRELRDGYVTRRMIPFPASVALVSMRNIRDYKARIRPDAQTMGSASPFNIITEALTLSSFSEEDIRTLYGQHTAATGQAFTDDAVATAYALTRGQPWLVNALARECVEKIHARRYAEPITAGDMESAKESIIRARGTHVD
ncbi:MAG: ATP-binding protein, partial [Kiritimatiellae bacterium]|nr:ATP-binding protein [Kiritimatiellia bacterium]